MARTATAPRTALARTAKPRTRTRVVEVAAPRRRRRAAKKKTGILGTGVSTQQAVAAWGLGAAQRAGQLANVPTMMNMGAEATIAIVAGNFGGGSEMAKDIALAAGIVALNHIGRTGFNPSPGAAGVGADEYDVEEV